MRGPGLGAGLEWTTLERCRHVDRDSHDQWRLPSDDSYDSYDSYQHIHSSRITYNLQPGTPAQLACCLLSLPNPSKRTHLHAGQLRPFFPPSCGLLSHILPYSCFLLLSTPPSTARILVQITVARRLVQLTAYTLQLQAPLQLLVQQQRLRLP